MDNGRTLKYFSLLHCSYGCTGRPAARQGTEIRRRSFQGDELFFRGQGHTKMHQGSANFWSSIGVRNIFKRPSSPATCPLPPPLGKGLVFTSQMKHKLSAAWCNHGPLLPKNYNARQPVFHGSFQYTCTTRTSDLKPYCKKGNHFPYIFNQLAKLSKSVTQTCFHKER